MKMKILNGHTSEETAYRVDNYPWGFKLRTSKFYWIETTKKKGDRFCSYTIDPRTGKACKPKKSTYNSFMFLYVDESNGHVKHGVIQVYKTEEFPKQLQFIIDEVQEVTDDQLFNLRSDYYGYTKALYPWHVVKYNDERKPLYKDWMTATLKHIRTAEIDQLCNFPPAPEQDQPDEEVKMIVTERVEL